MQLTELRVSVVVTSHNYAEYLGDCLESIISQDYPHLEILVADDNSQDDSLAVARRFEKRDSRVIVLANTENVGLARNKNRACAVASGDLLTFIDADDFYASPRKISDEVRLYRELVARGVPEPVVYSIADYDMPRYKIHDVNEVSCPEGDIFIRLLTRRVGDIPRDPLLSAELFRRVGGFDDEAKLYVDWSLHVRLAAVATFHCVRKIGVVRRIHGVGMSKASPRIHLRWILRGYRKNYRHLPLLKRPLAHVILSWTLLVRVVYPWLRDSLIGKASS